jgi:nucleoside-diphosphate-sugar epimerase
MANIFITGSNGFVGQNLIKVWQDRHTITGVDCSPRSLQTREVPPTNFNDINADLNEELYAVKDFIQGQDVVVHCAARTRIDPSWSEFKDYYNTNIAMTQDLLRECQLAGVKKFIYFSSSSVYGHSSRRQQSESDPLRPTSPYAVSKASAELALSVQCLKGNTEVVVVRPFTMYGDYMNFGKYSLAIARFLQATEQDHPLILENAGVQSREYVHVLDCVQALELIIEQGRHGDVYNIGTGNSITIKSIADAISSKQIIAPARTGHIDRTCADITRLGHLGYEPKHDLFRWLTEYKKKLKIV